MIDQLEERLGIDKGTLAKAVAGEEVSFDLEAVHIQPKADYDTLIGNYEADLASGKEQYQKEGRTVGLEIGVKKARESHGLEFEGKTIDNLLKAYGDKLKTEMSVEPNTQIDSLTKDNDLLKQSLEKKEGLLSEKENEILNIHSEYKKKSDQVIISDLLRNESEKYVKNTHYKQEDLNTLFSMGNDIRVEDGNPVFYDKNGDVIKNELRQPVTVEEVYKSFMENGYLKKPTGGRGDSKEGKGGKYSYESFVKSQAAEGNKEDSEAFNKAMQVAVDNDLIEF
tara:strand:+ start:5777 stop:6619 length:843 start_codon:yes stop_codon:yes gene_type:complete